MNDFEKACNEVERDRDYSLEQENCVEFLRNADVMTVTFTQGRFINKVEKLAKQHPDEVQVTNRNYNRKGKVVSIVAHLPVHCLHLSWLKKDLSEEERKTIGERINGSSITVEL
jgi:translation initiation factor 1 (eIF-1/SUI1)